MNICFSGGATGSDTFWGELASKFGHYVCHFGFKGMRSKQKIYTLSEKSLLQADFFCQRANKVLQRGNFRDYTEHTKNLLRRNFYQIRYTDRVYVVGWIEESFKIRGGSGWAVQMALDMNIQEIYIFDQDEKGWFKFSLTGWESIDSPPSPYGFYTAIGTRKLTPEGEEAIRSFR